MRYSIDKNNHLIITRKGRSIPLFGAFEVDESNRLIYWLDNGKRIVFTGAWSLNNNYELEFTLKNNSGIKQRDVLRIKGEIISAEADRLVFEIQATDNRGNTNISLLQLSGNWQADEYNQLVFLVSKKDSPDLLTLKGAWTINKNQQIEYTWQKTELERKAKITSKIELRGFWQIFEANKLTYMLSSATSSRFDFKAQLESLNLYPKKGEIKYRLGVGLRDGRRVAPRIIALYGAWKFGRNLALSFDMDYARGEVHSLQFGAEVNFTKSDEVIFNLINQDGKKLGLSVVFNHRFLKSLDAKLFVRLKRLADEAGVDVGVRIPF